MVADFKTIKSLSKFVSDALPFTSYQDIFLIFVDLLINSMNFIKLLFFITSQLLD